MIEKDKIELVEIVEVQDMPSVPGSGARCYWPLLESHDCNEGSPRGMVGGHLVSAEKGVPR
jgi:hypothetical protein